RRGSRKTHLWTPSGSAARRDCSSYGLVLKTATSTGGSAVRSTAAAARTSRGPGRARRCQHRRRAALLPAVVDGRVRLLLLGEVQPQDRVQAVQHAAQLAAVLRPDGLVG